MPPRLPILVSLLSVAMLGCSGKPAAAGMPDAPAPQQSAQQPAPHPAPPQPEVAKTPAPAPAATAKVLETMDAGGYTYARLDVGGKEQWYAVQQCVLHQGDAVKVPANAMAMHDFESKTLNRKFDTIYFAQALEPAGASSAPAAHAAAKTPPAAAPQTEVKDIAKAEGGVTVAEIWAKGAAGAGEEVTLRGKVVKYNGGILGKNWLHVRDGSGAEGSNDITVTTSDEAKVGDIVLVKGKVQKDRDFGAGYSYALLLEDAKVTVE